MEGLEHTFQKPRFASTLFKGGRVAEQAQEHYGRTEIGEREGGQEATQVDKMGCPPPEVDGLAGVTLPGVTARGSSDGVTAVPTSRG